jgi:hypothetical protein
VLLEPEMKNLSKNDWPKKRKSAKGNVIEPNSLKREQLEIQKKKIQAKLQHRQEPPIEELNSSPTKSGLKPQSNRTLIRNALIYNCLAGAVNEKLKKEVLQVRF